MLGTRRHGDRPAAHHPVAAIVALPSIPSRLDIMPSTFPTPDPQIGAVPGVPQPGAISAPSVPHVMRFRPNTGGPEMVYTHPIHDPETLRSVRILDDATISRQGHTTQWTSFFPDR